MTWFDRHFHDVIEEQAAAPERIAPDQRGRQIFLTCNLSGGTFSVCENSTDTVGAGGNSCMQCHYSAGIADFSWSLVPRSK
jgi:hypothetical protein